MDKSKLKRVLSYLLEHSRIAANLTLDDIGQALNIPAGGLRNCVGLAMEQELIDGCYRKISALKGATYVVTRVDGITRKGEKYLKENL